MKLNQVVAGVLLATGVTGAYAGEFKAAAQPEKAVKGQYIVVLDRKSVV